MDSIFTRLLYEAQERRDAVLVTIVAGRGSAPRGTGSQMLVGERGRLLGTIGGGAVEKRSEELALEMLRRKESGLHDFRLHENKIEDIGMVCGGDVTVLFQYISCGDEAWMEIARRAVGLIHTHEGGWFVQRTDGGTPTLLDRNKAVCAGAPIADPAPLAGGTEVLREPYFSKPLPVGERAIVFGGGHCAKALVPLLKTVGFRVTLMDSRPEFSSREAHPDAEELICGDFLRIEDYLTIKPEDYAVVMTNGHSFDFEVQDQLLRRELAYIGVIGSRSKTAAVNKRLAERGIPQEAIDRVHTPIGTKIKAVTPEEIAVSIAGEMIYERALRREAAGIKVKGCPMH